MKRSAMLVLVCVIALLAAVHQAHAWWATGHRAADLAAIRMLPDDMPAFFRRGGAAIAASAPDPDMWADKRLEALRSGERAEHYIDLELLQGRDLPRTRAEFEWLCDDLRVPSHKIGRLPYAIQEWYERLLIAFLVVMVVR